MNGVIIIVAISILGMLFGCSDSFSGKAKNKSSSNIQNVETDQNIGSVDEATSSDTDTKAGGSTAGSSDEDLTSVSEQADAPAVVSGAFLTRPLSSGLYLVCNKELDKDNTDQTADVLGCNILNPSKEKIIDFKLVSISFFDKLGANIQVLGNDVSTNVQDDWILMIKIEEGKVKLIENVKIELVTFI